jgi:long-subunit acyl-CoA synthetase (AMP-forming)
MASIRTPAEIIDSNATCVENRAKIVNDYNIVYDAFVTRVMEKVTKQIHWNVRNAKRAVTEIVVMRYMDLEEYINKETMQTKIKPSTFFTGFYNAETGNFNFDAFVDAGIDEMVFDKAKRAFGEKGYILLDISDPSKSKKKLCTITWGVDDSEDEE